MNAIFTSKVGHVTSFAEILERLKANPVKAQRQWHKRVKNSYRSGQPCDCCGRNDWSIGRKTAECNGCGNSLLLEATI